MAADEESVYSSANDNSDPDRDERTNAILQESSDAFDNLRSRVLAYQTERRNKESKSCAAHVKAMIEATERRKDIEARMANLVIKMNVTTQELEEMMMKGYFGREEDMRKNKDQKTT
ncbi:hypothetical protein G7Z17_g10971 [Cylindrodendrum hubeiense]|uniref:Uncharacterized protein n=1 Tax=Cylindrodendrum hubeiense TaxID=595255 RepID=A0A9P5GWR2_9HYPO|nr:hypothetical protein G7Z17_g10971 [Cylindrodendrum hubeiense]